MVWDDVTNTTACAKALQSPLAPFDSLGPEPEHCAPDKCQRIFLCIAVATAP